MNIDRHHIIHYIIIFCILTLGFSLVMVFSQSPRWQLFALSIISLLYVSYGILHHRVAHDLTAKIVLEYALVALLVVAVFLLRAVSI